MLRAILPLSSVTVVGSRLRLWKIILKNHCPAIWQLLKKIQVLPNVGEVVGPSSRLVVCEIMYFEAILTVYKKVKIKDYSTLAAKFQLLLYY
ncbi:hypothetical protein NQ315_014119 [Exocentrus adspersus]|uniref:Uncharacterized protein n=1 Tax=Exocentrus adspersus TaxID=1586481 RepID=A0AAV8VVJ6_9CUCU|nr:hypothetical protein NQ315_014119 [Exocentrus adspersus]